jgi:hypothetical protein
MKNKIPALLSLNARKKQLIEQHKIPLSSRMPIITDIYSNSIIKKPTNTFFRKSYSKNGNNFPKKKIQISKKLLYVFKDPKEKYKKKFVWPKITHPKLPFSERLKIPPEERKKKIMEQKPSHLFHDFYTIKWLRKKYSDSLIEKSVFSMLPDNGKPVVPEDESEEDKKHRLLMEYVDSLYKKVPEREKYVNINPKYFFDKRTFEKILKFKEIFLEFDEDQSRKMEIDEMVEMFNQNHINANLKDLVNLFFKGKNIKEEDIMKLYLDFYQFMNFALTKDQDFREFMREIKLKNKKKEEGLNRSKNDEEGKGYLPMNFNLMFDYFLIKGKERASIEAIENSINEMDKIINNEKNEVDKENENPEEKLINKSFKRSNTLESNKNLIDEENNENSKYYDEQLKNLNFCELIQNFTNLFSMNDLAMNENNNGNGKKPKKEKNDENEEQKSKNQKNLDENKKKMNDDSNDTMEDFLKNQMNKKIIKKLNIQNYKKLKNVKLALTATKEQVKSFIGTKGNNLNNLYKIQINAKNRNINNNGVKTNTNINTNDTISLSTNYKKKDSHDSNKEKKMYKTSTYFMFRDNKNRIKKENNINKRKIMSFRKEQNINSKNIKDYIHKTKYNSISLKYYPKYNNDNYKLDYVPFELFRNNNNE